mmetsp:Transcript_62641/g.179676  ORF Transcript_62641/g.179676 Transcript_62641/m.179676 type:complete len:242 (+) Transcript_62641:107-832(+)
MLMQGGSSSSAGTRADRAASLGRLLEELEAVPASEVWHIRIYAGLRRIVYEGRLRGASLMELFDGAEGGHAAPVLSLLDGRALARLGATCRHWRATPQWVEHWFLLGVRDFGKHRRLVPPGRFERFDESMLVADVDWAWRYRKFVDARHCPSIESLRLAAVRVVQALDLETSGVEEVRRRLATELQLGQDFFSLECVEQLLEDASSMRSLTGRSALLDAAAAEAALLATPAPSPEPPEPRG